MEEYMKIEKPIVEAIERANDVDAVRLMRELDTVRRTKPVNYRDRGKLLLLSVMYGLGADSLSFTMGIELEEAQDLLERLHNELSGVRNYETQLKNHVRKTGYLTMVGGRRRRFPNYALPEISISHPQGAPIPQSTVAYVQKSMEGVWKYNERRDMINVLSSQTGLKIKDNRNLRSEDETRILNSIIQGSAARMTKLALIYLRNNERLAEINQGKMTRGITLQVHDEIIIQAPKEHAEEAQQILVDAMYQAAYDCVKDVPFALDAEVMERWEAE